MRTLNEFLYIQTIDQWWQSCIRQQHQSRKSSLHNRQAKCVYHTHTHTHCAEVLDIGRCYMLRLERYGACVWLRATTHESVPASEHNGPMQTKKQCVKGNAEAHGYCECVCGSICTIDRVIDRLQSANLCIIHTHIGTVDNMNRVTDEPVAHFHFLLGLWFRQAQTCISVEEIVKFSIQI